MNTAHHNSASRQHESLIEGEQQMLDAGAAFARQLVERGQMAESIICLSGDLGAGKTTFSRGFIQACGHKGSVKSPTYTLMELYETPAGVIYHLDLYRLEDPEELEFIGFRDLFGIGATLLIEWPEREPGLLETANIRISIEHHGAEARKLTIIDDVAR